MFICCSSTVLLILTIIHLVPGEPRNLMISMTLFNSTLLTWEEPFPSFGAIVHYVVTLWTDDILVNEVNVSTTEQFLVLNGNTDYSVSVQAVTAAGGGNRRTVNFTTPRGPRKSHRAIS